jgi:hypothetical protein
MKQPLIHVVLVVAQRFVQVVLQLLLLHHHDYRRLHS